MVNVMELLNDRGINLRKASTRDGGEYHGPCPGCGGEDRFVVSPAQNDGKGRYWCRKCDKKGDNIQFLRDFEWLSYQDACRKLGVAVRGYTNRRP